MIKIPYLYVAFQNFFYLLGEFASGTDTMTSTKLPEKPPPAVPQPEPEGSKILIFLKIFIYFLEN